MQRVADVVHAGAHLYIQGSTRLEKTAFRCVDFHQRFQINESRARAVIARKNGQAVARWLGWHEAGMVHWVLLLEGENTPETGEKWRNALTERIQSTGYELVRQTRPNASKPAWTWRYSSKREQELRDQLVAAVRQRHDVALDQLVHLLWRSPGFRGVRVQVKRFGELLRAEWRRARSASEMQPHIPAQIGYVRRLADVGLVWSDLMKEVQNESLKT